MNSVPLSSEQIPSGTGLVQFVECKGVEDAWKEIDDEHQFTEPLDQPVKAQVTTFANGVRRVCCIHAIDILNDGNVKCCAGKETKCIYSWGRRKEQ